MKKIQTVYTTTALCVLLTPVLLFAQTGNPFTGSAASTTKTTTQTCEKITEKVDQRITKFTDVGSSHSIKLDKTIDTVRTISEKLKARNIDTSILDNQIVTLLEKKTKLDTDTQAFVAKLQESRGFTCGASQGQFKTKVAEAKKLQQVVVADVKDIHEFSKTIRETIKALRPQVASSTPAIL
ncbi:MAG: hypothetical protein RI996_123 [Candidatus Parcubacteria bacterium]|jgi:hypothetical protein